MVADLPSLSSGVSKLSSPFLAMYTRMSPLAAVLTNGVHLGEEIVRTVLGQTANTLMYEYVA